MESDVWATNVDMQNQGLKIRKQKPMVSKYSNMFLICVRAGQGLYKSVIFVLTHYLT